MQKRFLMFFVVFALALSITAPGLAAPTFPENGEGRFYVTDVTVSGNEISINWITNRNVYGLESKEIVRSRRAGNDDKLLIFLGDEVGKDDILISSPIKSVTTDGNPNIATGTFVCEIPIGTPAGTYYLTILNNGGDVNNTLWEDPIIVPVSYFQWNINFPGVEDVTIHTYIGGVWSQLPDRKSTRLNSSH